MNEQTTTSLLEGLADPGNESAWRELDARYRPVLIGFARRLGLGETDAHDAAQESLTRFFAAYNAGRYDRDRGRLRAWMIAIARNCVRDILAKQGRRRERRGMSAIEPRWEERELEAAWEKECKRVILWSSLDRLRAETDTAETTILAFEEVVFRGRPPAEVAEEFGISRNDVYLAKHRCLSRLRALIQTTTGTYTADERRST